MRPKIAVVEDNADNRLLVQAILDEEFEISEYETGKKAIDGLLNNVPDPSIPRIGNSSTSQK